MHTTQTTTRKTTSSAHPATTAANQASLLLVDVLLRRGAHATGAARSDETDLLSRGCIAAASGGAAQVVVVTATVGVVHGVHVHGSDNGPAVALHLVLVVVATGLEHGLVRAASARHDANLRKTVASWREMREMKNWCGSPDVTEAARAKCAMDTGPH